MSFLVRRNRPLAWAGFYDTFDRPPENPLLRPWQHLGGGESFINNLEELVVTEQIVNEDGRGPSYSYQPFTPCWGFETELWYPVTGLDNQHFFLVFTDSWARINSTKFQNAAAVGLKHEVGGADNVAYVEFPSMFEPYEGLRTWGSPVGAFDGQTLTLRVWCENDEWMRIWLNDIFVGSVMVSPSYRLHDLRRAVRLVNRSYCNVYVRWVHHYDRPPSAPLHPAAGWTESFYDDFNRANSSTVGNGWTKFGHTDSAIESNSWSTIGTNDGQRGILRDTGITSGHMRIEATVGGAVGINNAQDSGLILYSNSAGTQGLSANVFGNKLYISRFSGSIDGFTDISSLTSGVTVNTGDLVTFTVWNGVAWIEVAGQRVLYAAGVHSVVPATNTYAGLRTKRAAFNTSHSWNDVRILTAA